MMWQKKENVRYAMTLCLTCMHMAYSARTVSYTHLNQICEYNIAEKEEIPDPIMFKLKQKHTGWQSTLPYEK